MFVNIESISWLAFLALPYIGSHRPNETDIPVFRVQPFANSDVVLNSSWISARENLNTAYIKSLDVERLLHNFRINSGLPSGAKALEGWESPGVGLRGHFVGHYLSATAVLVERGKDIILARRLEYIVKELGKCQQALGGRYLSAFPESGFDELETRFSGVWAPYYTYHKIMQGLLDVYTRTSNQQALDIVQRMSEYVSIRMSKLDSQAIKKMFYTVAANPENEAGAMNEVLYKLYKITNNPKHLELAKIFDQDWFAIPLSKNHDILSGLHSNTHLVLVNGYAQRYMITGEGLYRDAALNFWNILENSHTYVNGTSSGPRPNVTTTTSLSAEHWGLPGHLSNTMTKEIAESCVTHNTQKLTAELFCWTAHPRYADTYMNTFYNAVLPSQNDQNGKCVYFLPSGSPRNKTFLNENDFRCCNGTAIEAFANLNSGIYYHNESDIWVDMYIPSRLTWKEKGIGLTQDGNFPETREVTFSVSAQKKTKFAINLFIPSWANATKVSINGVEQSLNTKPNSFLKLDKVWKDGDVVKLIFDYKFRVETMADDKNLIAFFYGPILLAFDTDSEISLTGNKESFLQGIKMDKSGSFQLKDQNNTYRLKPFYSIRSESYGVYATIRRY